MTRVGFVWGTDNTANMNTFLAALQTAAGASNNYTAEGVCKTGIYVLATAPVVGGAFGGNCVLQLPAPPQGGPKLKIALRGGSQDVSTLPLYQQMWPEVSGTCFMYIGPAGTNDATFSAASVFGTPTNPNIYVNESGNHRTRFVNMKIVMDSIRVVVPWAGGIGGIDLTSAAESDNRSCSCMALAIVPSGGSWTHMAMSANAARRNQRRMGHGLITGARRGQQRHVQLHRALHLQPEGLVLRCTGRAARHLVAVDIFCAYCVNGIETYSGNGISMVHNGHIVSAGVEFCQNAVGELGTGLIRMDIDNLRTESTTHVVLDASNRIQGRFVVRDQGAAGAYKSAWPPSTRQAGPRSSCVTLINAMTTPGALSGPASGDPGPPATTVAHG